MLRRLRSLVLVGMCITSAAGAAAANEFGAISIATPQDVPPLLDDAQLYDVHFVSARLGWAVGEHGVIWHTNDGGRSWRWQKSGVSFALRSVCFLTDQLGWAAGGGTEPFTHQSRGVVLHTTDGGETWKVLADSGIPQIYKIQFFGLDEGVMAGDAAANTPTGIFATTDGGKTWTPAKGTRVRGWRGGDFRAPDRGLVTGTMGRVAVVSEGNINPELMSEFGLPGLYDVKYAGGSLAWAVGDGGLVIHTNNGGVSWKAPPGQLPLELRNTFDFRAVTARGEKVWVAGRPGSVIWHSPDGGKSWQRQITGETVPIAALEFATDNDGVAVGALGMILTTADGGRTWQASRGGKRRAALLSLHTRRDQISVNLQAQLAGDAGYRSVVSLVPRGDAEADGDPSTDLDARIHEAAVKAGGSVGEVYWRLPMTVPGLEKNSRRLWSDWMRITEGKLPEVLVGQLVTELRMWRPNVIVIDEPSEDDAVGHVLKKAVLRAIAAAADSTSFTTHREVNELPTWQVTKLYARLPDGSAGDALIDPHLFLPQFRQSTYMASARAYGRLEADPNRPAEREAYRLLEDYGAEQGGSQRLAAARSEFFGGIHLASGGDARRQQLVLSSDLELERKVARLQKQSRVYLDKYMDDPRMSGQLVGQLNDFVNGITDAEMAVQLAELAAVYRRQGDWELAETVSIVLAERFPQQPAAHEAMLWLMHLWISGEATWRRAREAEAGHHRIAVDEQQLMAQLRTPRRTSQRSRFDQLNPRAQQELLQDVRHVLEAARNDPRQQTELPDTDEARTAQSESREFTASLNALKERFRELDRPADDTPQLQLAGGEQEKGRAIQSVQFAESNVSQYRMAERIKQWQQRAADMAELLQKANPELYDEPGTQFPLASLMRRRGLPGEADRIYRHFRQLTSDDPWSLSGASEIWFSVPRTLPPKPFSICVHTPQRPNLDGILSDPCWETAQEIPLTDDSGRADRGVIRPFAMLAYDQKYLYFAASFPRVPETPTDMPLNEGRSHDADLEHFDRVRLMLDVDRDHVTYYSFEFDQRGWTADACWDDKSWNAKYFVQANGDEKSWRVEVAIPWSELVPQPPTRNDVLNVGIVRTVPAVGLHSWTHPAAENPRPETFGLVKFD